MARAKREMRHEKTIQILDLAVAIVLFVVGCTVGKDVMERYDTWLSFNAPAIGILLVGELVWHCVRKQIIRRKCEEYET